jgi:Adenylate and Guanylate cyclase catalytic domain
MQDLVRHYGDDLQRSHGVPIQIRVGLDSGEVVLRLSGHGLHMSYTAIGLTVHMAKRMEQMARPGTVLAGSDTVRLVEGSVETRLLGPVKVKGFDKLVEVSEVRRAAMHRSRFDTVRVRAMMSFVGRDAPRRASTGKLWTVRRKSAWHFLPRVATRASPSSTSECRDATRRKATSPRLGGCTNRWRCASGSTISKPRLLFAAPLCKA